MYDVAPEIPLRLTTSGTSYRFKRRSRTHAGVAELADAPGLGPGPERGGGSSPLARTFSLFRAATCARGGFVRCRHAWPPSGIEAGDRLDHPVLLLTGEMRSHRQAEHLVMGGVKLRKAVGHGTERRKAPWR